MNDHKETKAEAWARRVSEPAPSIEFESDHGSHLATAKSAEYLEIDIPYEAAESGSITLLNRDAIALAQWILDTFEEREG